jgi:drug/metabolite transporter (DMT)-like permease
MSAPVTPTRPLWRAALPVGVLAIVWGLNWPILKIGVSELPPLTFRALTLPFAALGLFAVARVMGDSVRLPRAWWPRVCALALFNIAGWNGLLLFGVQQMAAGRSAILAYTMPIWATAIGAFALDEPLSTRKIVGLVLGTAGMALLLGDEFRTIGSSPFAAAMILGAALSWAIGTVLLRRWKPPIPQNTVTGWMMLLGWVPLVLAAPFFDHTPLTDVLARMNGRAWFAVLYNIFLAGTIAHAAYFTLARTLPVAVSSLASLPVPVVGVFAGMLVLGERPGAQEWFALALVVIALFVVMYKPARGETAVTPFAPDD